MTLYRDYFQWLARQDADAADAQWRDELADLDRGTFLAPAAIRDRTGAREYVWRALSSESTSALAAHARQCGVTINTMAQAAWGSCSRVSPAAPMSSSG